MTATPHPRRSVLYMPATNARALEKARTLDVDAIIFDLEDSVSTDMKEEGRARAIEAVKSGAYGDREVIIRINGVDTPWGEEDLFAISEAGPDAVLVPKISQAEEVVEVADLLTKYGAPDRTKIWAMMETPMGVLRCGQIAASHPRLACLVMGSNDLVKSMHARHRPDRQSVLAALSFVVMAARAYDLAALDAVYGDFGDEEGFRVQCHQSVSLGFDGCTLIHPSQISAANEIYSPTMDEIAEAREVIEVWREAERRGAGVAALNGRMIEALHVEDAQRVMMLADAIEKTKERRARLQG